MFCLKRKQVITAIKATIIIVAVRLFCSMIRIATRHFSLNKNPINEKKDTHIIDESIKALKNFSGLSKASPAAIDV